MTVREFAQVKNHKIVGKLVRNTKLAYQWDTIRSEWVRVPKLLFVYEDEAGNAYYHYRDGSNIIVTFIGDTIK